jgi:hypothetical protein
VLTGCRQIIDDDFLHAFRIYRDRDSKAVRLQASVLHGEMKRFVDFQEADESASYTHHANRSPVWTAFITTYLRSSRWLKRAGPETVHLSELRRFCFSSAYVPEQTQHGEHILKFTSDHGKTHSRKTRLETDNARWQMPRNSFEALEILRDLNDDIDEGIVLVK